MIEPTPSLEGAFENAGLLKVLSEPLGIEVQVEGNVIGKSSIFSARFPTRAHVLRIKNSEIHLVVDKTTAVSWLKGCFINIFDRVGYPPRNRPRNPGACRESKTECAAGR